ncbi:MAG: caspase family protein [Deltaproteobacteria bacterium]|nr:caspase family protein [Deltaproteobacteria bacterium]
MKTKSTLPLRLSPLLLAAVHLALGLLLCSSVDARMRRYALIVGNNSGAKDEAELRYSGSDAQKLQRVLRGLGGFHLEDTVLLLNEKASTVLRALKSISTRIAHSKQDAMLLVYFSGHADEKTLHLGDTSLDLRQFERLLRATPAKFRLMILDACRSGSLTRVKGGRVKGGRKQPGFKITIDRPLSSQGTVFLTASTASEDAQESDRLRGSFFTHYLVSGLLGAADVNGDGKVVLEEAYRHAYDNTIKASSRTLAGTQHPTFRYELRGQGQIVLTHPGDADSHGVMLFPKGRSYLVIQGHSGGRVVGEVGVWDRMRAISVRPGKYFIRGRGRREMLEGTMTVRAKEHLTVRESGLSRIAYARLVRKGAGTQTVSQAVVSGYRFRTPMGNADTLCHGMFAGYALALEYFSLGARLGVCRGRTSSSEVQTTADELDLELRISHLWDFPWVTAELGVAAASGLLQQSFEGERVAPPRVSAFGQVGIVVGLHLDLPMGLDLFADLAVQTYFFKTRDSSTKEESFGASFALRPTFGLGKHW